MPSIKLRRMANGIYYVRVYDGARTPKEKAISTGTRNKREAETARNTIALEILGGTRDPWAAKGTSVAVQKPLAFPHAAEAFMESRAGKRPATRSAYRTALNAIDRLIPAGIRLDAVVLDQLTPYLTDESVAEATRQHRTGHLRAFFQWCVKKGLCPVSPLADFSLSVQGESAPGFFTPDEIDRLLGAMERSGDLWLRDAVVLAVCTGLRRGELCALRWEGVSFAPEGVTLTLRNGAHGFYTKSKRNVLRPVFGEALDVLARLAATRPSDAPGDDTVLTGVKGGPLYPSFLSHRFKAYVRSEGLRGDLHFHSLRHTCGTWMMRAGAPEAVTAKMLGHSSTQVTRKYTHAVTDDLRAFGDRAFQRRVLSPEAETVR